MKGYKSMTIFPRLVASCALALVFSPALGGLSAHADDIPAQMQALVAKQSPAVVTVRAVLKMQMTGGGASQSTESRTEMQGVVVDPTGLIMVSSLPFSPAKMIEMMGMPSEAAAGAPKIVPTDFKVVFEREDKEYPAFLAATDATLGLAFIQIEDLGGRALTSVSFAASSAPALGDPVFAVVRLSKGYDYAPFYEGARVSGAITKPRPALILDGGVTEVGMPVYALSGDAVGVLTSIASGVPATESNAGMSMRMMMRMFGGASGGNHGGIFVVPGSAVAPIIAQAEARAVSLAAQRAKPAAPAAPAAPATPTAAGK